MSKQLEKLYKLQPKDVSKTAVILADAFQHDPVWNKIFEGETRPRQKLLAFYQTPIRYCLKYGQVYAISENLEGIAAWAPGCYADMTIWRMIRSGAIKSGMQMGFNLARKMEPVFKPLLADRRENMKGRSYIYLQIIGVAPQFQGRGFGGKLLRALFEQSEQAGQSLYLETETERNAAMYEKYGFKLIKQITLPIIKLPMWEMVRDPGR